MPVAQFTAANGIGQQVLAVHAVEHEVVAVARRLQQQLALDAVDAAVDEDRDLGGVPVVRVVRRRLEAPLQLVRCPD